MKIPKIRQMHKVNAPFFQREWERPARLGCNGSSNMACPKCFSDDFCGRNAFN